MLPAKNGIKNGMYVLQVVADKKAKVSQKLVYYTSIKEINRFAKYIYIIG